MTLRRVLVVTVVHHPGDARIRARQIAALLEAGWQVTYAAPWTGFGLPVPPPADGLRHVDLPRAVGRSRLRALVGARRVLREQGGRHDLVLLHDPELLAAAAGLRLGNIVWDVHEDTAAAIETKEWLPAPLRGAASAAMRAGERLVERRRPLLLADERYRDRFAREHPVVPNTTRVPEHARPAATPAPDGSYRVVYLGSLTIARGAEEIIRVAQLLARTDGPEAGARGPGERADDGRAGTADATAPCIRTEVIGSAHGRAETLLHQAAARGELSWSGYLPNDEALARVEGAVAGLSLLHDEANFRPSLPTKVAEYLARGVPVVTTPLPVAVDLVERSRGGVVVPFGPDGVAQTVRQVRAWCARPQEAVEVGARGHAFAREHLDWAVHGRDFVARLEQIRARIQAQASPRRARTSP